MQRFFKWPFKLSNALYLLFALNLCFSAGLLFEIGTMDQLQMLYLILSDVLVFFAGFAFVHIWNAYAEKFPFNKYGKEETDYGFPLLACAMLCWGLGSVLTMVGEFFQITTTSRLFIFSTNLISPLNSAFFLSSIYYFRHNDSFFKFLRSTFRITPNNYLPAVWIITFVVSVIIGVLIFRMPLPQPNEVNVPAVVDSFLLGIPTIVGLGVVFFKSFWQRQLKLISFLCLLAMFLTFFVQFWRANSFAFLDWTIERYPLFTYSMLILYRIMLVTIFFALALSWISEEQNKTLEERNSQLNEKNAALKALSDKLDNQRYEMNHAIRKSLGNLKDDLAKRLNHYSGDEDTKASFIIHEIRDRVSHLFLLHDHLNEGTESIGAINLYKYLSKLFLYLKESNKYVDENFTILIEPLRSLSSIDIRYARDIGYILTELVFNAHCNTVTSNVVIQVSAEIVDGYLRITVIDNGKGIDDPARKSFGLNRIHNVAKFLNGDFRLENNSNGVGSTAQFTAPISSLLKHTQS